MSATGTLCHIVRRPVRVHVEIGSVNAYAPRVRRDLFERIGGMSWRSDIMASIGRRGPLRP